MARLDEALEDAACGAGGNGIKSHRNADPKIARFACGHQQRARIHCDDGRIRLATAALEYLLEPLRVLGWGAADNPFGCNAPQAGLLGRDLDFLEQTMVE
jgi:hypothetical protein